jgi:CAAX prenyl protease-like protein
MPSPPKTKANSSAQQSTIFMVLLFLSLILWFLYRGIFNFSVVFDETIGKAIFFGLPIWIYISATGDKKISESIVANKMAPGLLRGLAYGGLFGFVAILLANLTQGSSLVAAPLFMTDEFWWKFFLALLTAFWESLFFYSFIQTTIGEQFKKSLSNWQQVLIVSLIFLLFHMSNVVLRFSDGAIAMQIILLYLFGLGQAIIFAKEKNVYTLILTHALWGMVLLIHF